MANGPEIVQLAPDLTIPWSRITLGEHVVYSPPEADPSIADLALDSVSDRPSAPNAELICDEGRDGDIWRVDEFAVKRWRSGYGGLGLLKGLVMLAEGFERIDARLPDGKPVRAPRYHSMVSDQGGNKTLVFVMDFIHGTMPSRRQHPDAYHQHRADLCVRAIAACGGHQSYFFDLRPENRINGDDGVEYILDIEYM